MKLTLGSLFACAAIAGGVVSAAPDVFDDNKARSQSTDAPSGALLASDEERGSTIPSDERELAFAMPGLISTVNVKNGDVIKKGQVLAKQDTEVEQAALAKEKYLLKSNVQLRAATAQKDLATVELKRVKELRAKDAASMSELEKATMELTVAGLKEELAKEETESKRLEIAKLELQVKRMTLVSRFDGTVRKVDAAVGEVSDPQKPSITVVSNDPLWVETKLPINITADMKIGQSVQVRYLGENKWREAKIIFFDPVADATIEGGAQLVHLELANPEGRRAGQSVAVKLPQNVAAAK